MTALSVYVELAIKENNTDEYFAAAKSKFETGIAMLQMLDPNNPMTLHFLQKQSKWKKQKRNKIIGILVFVAFCLGIVIWGINDGQNQETPNINDIIDKFRKP